jgi:hypothetical protein
MSQSTHQRPMQTRSTFHKPNILKEKKPAPEAMLDKGTNITRTTLVALLLFRGVVFVFQLVVRVLQAVTAIPKETRREL